jgi:hypothetical protein
MTLILTLFNYFLIIKENFQHNPNFTYIVRKIYSNNYKIENNFQAPHLLPHPLKSPERIYKPKLDKNLIGVENRNKSLIYQ